jgi:hypothetical protein
MYTNNIRFFIGSLTLVVLLVVLTCVANAQQATCESRDTVLQTIKGKFNEQLIFRGISKRGHITLVYLNDKTGSWTATIIRPTDPTAMCGVDVGTTGEAISNAQKTLYQQKLQ